MDMQTLIKQCASGDDAAFGELVELYKTKIINTAFGLLQNREDAYDIAQEVFIKLYRKIGDFAGDASLDTWIYRITVNTCLDEMRRRNRRIKTMPLTVEKDEDVLELPLADTSGMPEEVVLRSEQSNEILKAVAALPQKYKTVLVLREFEDMDYERIAVTLNISVGTVKSRLSRAREKLRNLLGNTTSN